MVNIGRCVVRNNGKIGGRDKGVFYVPDHKNLVEVVDGAMVSSVGLNAGDKIFAGDLGYFDYKTGMVTHLKAWRVKKAVTAADTTVVLEGGGLEHRLSGAAVLAKAPVGTNGVAGTVTGVAIAADKIANVGDEIILTIAANAFGVLAVGDVLVLATEAGASKQVVVPKVNFMFGHDVVIYYTVTDDYSTNIGDGSFTVQGYFSATVYQNAKVIPPYALALNKLSNNDYLFKL